MKAGTQRVKELLFILSISLLLTGFSGCQERNQNTPSGLMTDLLTNPAEAVITNPQPRFSWIPADGTTTQSAYQIIVASSKKLLGKNQGDIWDSGKTTSDASVSVSYQGNPLKSNTTYFWKVKTWDQNDKSGGFSNPQQFITGSFDEVQKKWPGESRWVTISSEKEQKYVFENRQTIDYIDVLPEKIEKNEQGNVFVSFEKAAFGALKLNIDPAKNSDTLIIHLGEKKTEGKSVDRNPGGSIIYNQLRVAMVAGQKEYLVTIPRFISHYPNSQVLADHMPEVTSFRYVEIEGLKQDLNPEQVIQHALLYPFDDEASFFHSSDDKLNQIWDLCKHTLKVTPFLGIYIDGGARERMPYEADAYMQQVAHYCVDREFAIQRYTADFLIFNPSWPTEWHLHMVLMAWADYMATGDERFLRLRYDELKKKTLIALAREDGLISTRTGLVTPEFLQSIHYNGRSFRDIVDWPQGTPANETVLRSGHGSVSLAGETDRYVFSDINTVVNAFHYRNLVLMAEIAGALELSQDAQFFKDRASAVKNAMNEKLISPETQLYTDGEGVDHSTLHANMFPVTFGLAPGENYPQIRDFLISRGMACSPGMSMYLFDALYKMDAEDYAFSLLTSETDRSWMNMIRFGTTVTSEAWDLKYKRNMTWNHAWGAIPAYVISRRICGIEPLEPSFRKIKIMPRPGPLQMAEIKHPTIRGAVSLKYENRADAFVMQLTLPPNTTTDVYLPAKGENYSLIMDGGEIKGEKTGDRILIKNVAAGDHAFELKKQ